MRAAAAARPRRPPRRPRSCERPRGSFSPGASASAIQPYPEWADVEVRPLMHAHGRLSLARFLAPIALVAFAVAVFAIVTGSGVLGEDSSSESTDANDLPAATGTTAKTTTTPKQKKT